MLQKRRELKAAGVESKLVGVKKRKYIDYAREIPFQQLVPSGFYDVGDERKASKTVSIDPKTQGLELAKMEGRHQKEEEDKEKQRDKKRLKTLFKANAPLAVLNLSEQNDPTTLRRRSSLSLPAPQGEKRREEKRREEKGRKEKRREEKADREGKRRDEKRWEGKGREER
jgi:pre-mRNA-splicing factor CDC5/CEF1